MSISSRLDKLESFMTYRELALLWLKKSQAQGGYSEYAKFGEFQPWVAENEEAGLIYYLATTVNGSVLLAAQQWRALASWGSLLGISMLDLKPGLKPFKPYTVAGFFERWRNLLCRLFAQAVAVQQAVDLISEGYFDGHDVLFADAKAELSSCFETAKLLVLAYNRFAEENGKELIDIETLGNKVGRRVSQRLNEWVMLSRSRVLAASGQLFEARDEVLRFIAIEDAAENDPVK
jgi:hypothetical protein